MESIVIEGSASSTRESVSSASPFERPSFVPEVSEVTALEIVSASFSVVASVLVREVLTKILRSVASTEIVIGLESVSEVPTSGLDAILELRTEPLYVSLLATKEALPFGLVGMVVFIELEPLLPLILSIESSELVLLVASIEPLKTLSEIAFEVPSVEIGSSSIVIVLPFAPVIFVLAMLASLIRSFIRLSLLLLLLTLVLRLRLLLGIIFLLVLIPKRIFLGLGVVSFFLPAQAPLLGLSLLV